MSDLGVRGPCHTAKRYMPAGYYPNGYRVGYDAQAKEYRIALTGLGCETDPAVHAVRRAPDHARRTGFTLSRNPP